MYYPSMRYKYKMFNEINETQNPHCLISTGGGTPAYNQKGPNDTPQMIHEVSLFDIYTGVMKAVYSVDDTMQSGDEAVEVSDFYAHDPIELMRKPGTSKFRTNIIKGFNSNYVSKILCPMLPNKQDSASYFISAGTDRKIRYWTLVKSKRQSFYNINTPAAKESEYKNVFLGDVVAVQEKVTDKKAEPTKLQTGITYGKRKKAVLANKGNAEPLNAINEYMYPDSGGMSSCQTLFDHSSSHTDAILDMAIAQNDKLGPYLFTAGRDGVIKIFS